MSLNYCTVSVITSQSPWNVQNQLSLPGSDFALMYFSRHKTRNSFTCDAVTLLSCCKTETHTNLGWHVTFWSSFKQMLRLQKYNFLYHLVIHHCSLYPDQIYFVSWQSDWPLHARRPYSVKYWFQKNPLFGRSVDNVSKSLNLYIYKSEGFITDNVRSTRGGHIFTGVCHSVWVGRGGVGEAHLGPATAPPPKTMKHLTPLV